MADSEDSTPSVTSVRNGVEDWDLTQEQWDFLSNLPEPVRNEFAHDMMDNFDRYNDNTIDTVEFELARLKLIKDYPEHVAKLKKFLPPEATVLTTAACFVPDDNFMDKVREALYDNSDKYITWLTTVQEYNKESMSTEEFERKASPLFTDHPDLLKELSECACKGKPYQTVEEYSTSNESTVMSSAVSSKRRKTK